jgi:hypothetical protein
LWIPHIIACREVLYFTLAAPVVTVIYLTGSVAVISELIVSLRGYLLLVASVMLATVAAIHRTFSSYTITIRDAELIPK